VPAGARDLLDIGGSHGYNAVVLCRRHAGLRAVIFDLPAAVEQAAPILAKEGMGDRVVHRAGDALADDLGAESWDVVFVAQLVHHFDAATNRELARRVARALRPGGVFVIQEAVRPSSPKQAGQAGTLLDLYFALTSQAGTWSYDEMADWQRQAGLEPRKPIRFRTVPGVGQQVAVKRG
jgi:predicted O-methyltransferase YrrM